MRYSQEWQSVYSINLIDIGILQYETGSFYLVPGGDQSITLKSTMAGD